MYNGYNEFLNELIWKIYVYTPTLNKPHKGLYVYKPFTFDRPRKSNFNAVDLIIFRKYYQ